MEPQQKNEESAAHYLQTQIQMKRTKTAGFIIKLSKTMGYLLYILAICIVVLFPLTFLNIGLALIAVAWGLLFQFVVPKIVKQVIAAEE